MATPLRVLFIGLSAALSRQVRGALRQADYEPLVQTASDEQRLLKRLQQPPELIISEQKDHGFGAQDVLRFLHSRGLFLPLIVLTAEPSQEEEAECLREGALDYLSREQLPRLGSAVASALNLGQARQGMLADSQERYRTLVESMNEGVLTLDKDEVITFINPALCRLVGYPAEALLGRNVCDLVMPGEKEKLKSEIKQRRQGKSSTYELRLLSRDGQERVALVSAVPMMDQKGRYQGANAVFTDLTDLRRTQEGMRKAAEEWRQSFDAIDEMMLVLAPDMRVRRCNLTVVKTIGLPFKKIVGQYCYKILRGSDEPCVGCPHPQVIQTGRPAEIETDLPHLNRTASISISPIKDSQGQVTATVHIVRDISEKRSQEQETLRLTKALVESFQATTLALTSMVESRDPYTSGHTQGVAELCGHVGRALNLQEDDLQGLRVCALLHDIGKGSIPLDILNKPGKLSVHEMGIIREHPATAYHILKNISFPWPVAEVVWQHHERLDGSGYPRGLKEPQLHPWAKILAVCDVVEAMTSHRPYRPTRTMQEAFRTIQDGAGKLFDPGIVKAVISVLGLDHRRLLVVDDDPGVLSALIAYLERQGLQAEGFSDPAQAVAAFQKKPTPVVLTDLKMPGLSGLEVLKAVKARHPETEVIVVSGHGDKAAMVAAMRTGASDFLEKPVKMSELSDAVERARKRYSGESQTAGE
ncbi:MAG: response regulator [Desulfarculus sp.]|jgi:PAS domain S-box-containing protein/putative nucleotidyltransferase with HDIG domain|nr:MAG: response regulator [Desulfarculus sp.]